MPAKGKNDLGTIVLEPRTTITTFEGIPWGIQKAVGGSIASILFGDNNDAKSKFYKSGVSRRNKKTLTELSSQVYSYLNGTISEFADISEYVFRVWTRTTIQRTSGEIVGLPVFDIEIYKYVGRVAAQSVQIENYSIGVTFIGKKGDKFITPFMQRALKKAKGTSVYIKLDMYNDSTSAPTEFSDKISGGSPTLFINDVPYPVKIKSDDATDEIQLFIVDEGKSVFPLKSEDAVDMFTSKKSGLQPEILGFGTAFQSVDKELNRISDSILSSAKDSQETKFEDFLTGLEIEETIDVLETKLNAIKETELNDEYGREYKSINNEIGEGKKTYRTRKAEYKAVEESLISLEKDLSKNQMTYDTFLVARFRLVSSKKEIEQALTELQEDLKGDMTERVQSLVKSTTNKSR